MESIGCTFGGKTVIRLDGDRWRYARERGANGFVTQVGPEPGRGAVVMLRSEVDAMDLNLTKTLVWTGTGIATGGNLPGAKKTHTLAGLYVVNDPIRLDPSGDDNDDAPYLVEFTDKRWHLSKFSAINKAYNLRKPPHGVHTNLLVAGRFYSTSLSGGTTLWTWSTLTEDIWTTIGTTLLGAWPTLPYTPLGTPEDLRFFGVNAWEALHHVLCQIGCTTSLNPITGDFSIVRLGATQTNLAARELSYRRREMHNLDALSAVSTRVPETIRVFFMYRDERQPNNWALAPYSVDKTTGVTGAVAGTVLPLWSYIPARYDASSGLQSSADLDSLAGEIKDNWLSTYNTVRQRKVYMGIVADVLPGSQVRGVEWRDGGDGWRTTTIRRPEVAGDKPPAAMERLHSHEHMVRFELTATLSSGGSAAAFGTVFVSGAWANNIGGGTSTVTVYDSIGDKTGITGQYGWAVWSMESMRYEVIQLEC